MLDRLNAGEAAALLPEPGDAVDQGLGVGVLGGREDLPGGAGFHKLAPEHHGDAVGEAPDDAEVMGDDEDGHADAEDQDSLGFVIVVIAWSWLE